MTEQSNKWDRQWSELLTHCHGKVVAADPAFKADLLDRLKTAVANQEVSTRSDTDEGSHWRRLLKASYVPCHPDTSFKSALLTNLKAKQAEAAPEHDNDDAIRTILSQSYQPVEPRREFQTRLLGNLKERQRNTVVVRRDSRRRTIFMSAASGIAAAAMVMFAIGFVSFDVATEHSAPAVITATAARGIRLPVPDIALETPDRDMNSSFTPVSFGSSGGTRSSATPALYESKAAQYASYRVGDAFSSPVLPERAVALNLRLDGDIVADNSSFAVASGQSYRSEGGMGHINFSDGSLITLSPDSIVAATDQGFTVQQGFVLVAVPESSSRPFRLHFDERDLAVAPGTDMALMVEDPSQYAEGGAPAPMVMVLDSPGDHTGLAFARGKNGIGPLFARQLYRLDNYVTPDLPSRAMCDVEREDVNNLFKAETVYENRPFAAFAGGFSADRDLSFARTVMVPAGFTKKGDSWVAVTYRNEPTIKLEYLSDAYFGFVDERRDLSHALSLGGNVIIDGGDGVFYEIHK